MSTSRSLVSSVRSGWDVVCQHVTKATVFIDNPMAECLHWSVGVGTLMQAGAVGLKELSSFESGTAEERKAVFIVSGLLADTTEQIIKDIVCNSAFQYCIVITAVPHSLHAHLTSEGLGEGTSERGNFAHFEKKLKKWMADPIAETQVLHCPLFAAPISHGLFIIPAHKSLFPLLSSDLSRVQEGRDVRGSDGKPPDKLDNVELHMLPTALQSKLKMLVSSISGICEQLKVNEDVYAVGYTSRIIATELAGLPSAKTRRKAAQHRASVLLIDRTLDLAGPVSHLYRDTLADKVLTLLDRLPGHSVDVGVDMRELYSLQGAGSAGVPVLFPGCLSHPSDPPSQSLLNNLISTKQKESLMDVNRQLVDCISKEKLPLNISGKLGRAGPETIQSHVQLFKNNTAALRRNTGIIQIAMACVQALMHPDHEAIWEASLGSEKLFLQGLNEDSRPTLDQVLTILEKGQTGKMPHSLEAIILLLVFAYSLAGEDSFNYSVDEKSLCNLLVQAVMKEQKPSELITLIVGENRTIDLVNDAVNELIKRLRSVSNARGHLRNHRTIFDHGNTLAPASYKPFVKQLLDDVYNPNKPELPDVEYKSTGLRDLIKTGFRFFVNVSKPRPSDHPTLIVFIVGGVSCSEARIIKETVTSHSPNTQVLIGSTCILKPTDILRLLFSRDNLHPQG